CCAARHAAASSKDTYRREPTAVSRGPRPCAFSLKYMLMLSRWAKQNSRTEYQAGGTGGPRIGVALPFVCESGSLLVVGSIAVASAIGGPGSRFASSAVCAGFLPVISPRAIVVNSMKAHGAKYEHWKFAGRTDAVRCGELLVEKQIAQQTLHLSYVGLPAQGVLTELAHLRCRGHFLARASTPYQFTGIMRGPICGGSFSRLATRRDIGGEIKWLGRALRRLGGALGQRGRWRWWRPFFFEIGLPDIDHRRMQPLLEGIG